jgi:hypothetical protein
MATSVVVLAEVDFQITKTQVGSRCMVLGYLTKIS